MCFWRIYATSKRNRRPECQVPHLDMYRSIIWRLNPASLLQRWHLSKAVFGLNQSQGEKRRDMG